MTSTPEGAASPIWDDSALQAVANGRNVPFPGKKDHAILANLAAAGFEVVPSDVAKLGRAVQAQHLANVGCTDEIGQECDFWLDGIYERAGVERPS